MCSNHCVFANKALPIPSTNPVKAQANNHNTISNRSKPTTKPITSKTIVGVVLDNPFQRFYKKWRQGKAFTRSIYSICEDFRGVYMLKFKRKQAFYLYVKKRLMRHKEGRCFLIEIIIGGEPVKVIYANHLGEEFKFYTAARVVVATTVYDEIHKIIYKKIAIGEYKENLGTTSLGYLESHFGSKWQAPFKKAFPFQRIYANLMLAMYKITGDKQSLWRFGGKYYGAAKIARREILKIESDVSRTQENKNKTKVKRQRKAKRKGVGALPLP